jgi:hypothetical protein
MGKKNKASPEERAAKLLKDAEPLHKDFPFLTSPALFDFIQVIVKAYLDAMRYDQSSRDLIARFSLAYRQEAFIKFGHDTIETFALARLIRQANQTPAERKGQLDGLSYINGYKRKGDRLSGEQTTAAEYIISIWRGFSVGLGMKGSKLDGSGGGSGKAVQPLDVMNEELKKHHHEIYSPWYEIAKGITVARLRGQGNVSMAAIIYQVLIGDFYPEKLDAAFGLPMGTSLSAVKAGLGAYWSPEKLIGYGKRLPQIGEGAAAGSGKPEGGRSDLAGGKEPAAA